MVTLTAIRLLSFASVALAQSFGSSAVDASQFNSLASSIVQAHIPTSILPSLAIAIQTAIASATPNGTADINSLVRSAIYAPTPPPFLASGLPPDLQTRVNDMEDSISALRVQVSGFTTMSSKGVVGTVTIPVEQTQTARNGSVVVTRVPALLVNDTSTPTSSEMMPSSTAAGPSATSSGLAVSTNVPIAAGAVLGMLGLIAAL